MGLLANNFRDTLGVYKFYGAGVSNGAYPSATDANFHRTGATRNLCAGEGVTNQQAGYPYGHLHPQSWSMPQKAGGMSTYQEVTGSGTLAASILAVKLAQADLTGLGSLEAIGGLIVQLLSDIAGSGEVSDADVKAFLQALASIGGSGEISDANLEGFGAILAALAGNGTLDDSIATGTGAMAADLVVTGTGLTTSNVGQAVWSAIASANNVASTMGEKLNDAGSASNPWTEIIESGYTAAEILKILASVAAGSATGMDGAAVFKSLDGTKDRVESTISGADRTTTAIDAS
jgi:hypothetical protein